MLKNRISSRNFCAFGENVEPVTKTYQEKIRRGAVKRLQPKRKNCSRKNVFQHVPSLGVRQNAKLTYNILVQNAGKLISVFLNLALIAYLSRYLGVEGFGKYATVLRFVGFFGVIADLGLNVIITREISKHPEKEVEIVQNGFTLRIWSGFFILLLGYFIAKLFPYDHEIKKGILLVLPAFWFVLLLQIFTGVFQKRLKMDQCIISEVFSRVLLVLGTIVLIPLSPPLRAFFYVLNIGNAFWLALILLFIYRFIPIRLAFDWKLQKKLIVASLPLALINFFHLIYFNVDSLMLSVMKGPEDIGLYHMPYKIFEILFTLMVAFVTLFIPILGEHAKRKKYKEAAQKLFDNIALLSVSVGVIGVFFAKDIIGMLSSEAFIQATIAMKILFLASGFMFFNVLFKHLFVVMENQKKIIWIFGIGALLNVVANFFIIPKYSYNGAALTTLLSEGIIFILMAFNMGKMELHAKVLGKILIAFVIFGSVLYAVRELDLLWRATASIILFFILVKLFRLPLQLDYE